MSDGLDQQLSKVLYQTDHGSLAKASRPNDFTKRAVLGAAQGHIDHYGNGSQVAEHEESFAWDGMPTLSLFEEATGSQWQHIAFAYMNQSGLITAETMASV